MSLSVGREVAAIQKMTVKELRVKYAELFDDETRKGVSTAKRPWPH
jgi:hypothetical protein